MKKLSIAVLSAIMAMLMLVLTPTQIIAKAEAKVYVEDIIVVAAKDKDEAQKLAGTDYIVLDEPIYDGSADTGNNPRTKKSFLCYKTTSDPTNAITEIKALNMNAPWDYDTYNKYISDYKEQIKKDVKSLRKSIEEFQSNCGANTEDEILYPKSYYVYNVLQYLYDEDILTHENEDLRECARLGDLFLAFDFEDEDSAAEAETILVDILMEANAQCVNLIYNALTLACSETEDKNFLDIISGTNFKANNYIDANEYNDFAEDILCTISEAQREVKKYLESQVLLDESIFTVPAELADANAKLNEIIEFDNAESLKYFDQYIQTIKQMDPASVSPAERHLLIEAALCELTWYTLDDETHMGYLMEDSFKDIYWSFEKIFDSINQGKLTVDDYYAKIKENRLGYDNRTLTISEGFKDLLKLYTNDTACFSEHTYEFTELKTGKNLYNIFKSCAYRGYENNGTYEYETLYDLVMKYDMTGEKKPEGTYNPSDFYPIIAQLTDGQRGMLKTGIVNLVLSVEVTEEQYKKSFETLQTRIKDLAKGECKIDGVNPEDPCYSIFAGIDRDLYKEDSGVAMMKSAVDKSAQEKDYTFDVEKAKLNDVFTMTLCTIGIVGATALAGTLTSILVEGYAYAAIDDAFVAVDQVFEDFMAGATAQSEYVAAQSTAFTTSMNMSRVANIANIVGKVFGVVFAVAMIALSVVLLVNQLTSIWKKPENADYLGIPKIICNAQPITTYYMNLDGNWTTNEDVGYVYYYGVKNPTLKDDEQDDSKNVIGESKIADVANWSQSGLRQWIALFTTKSNTAGQPILASSLEITGQDFIFGKRTVSMFSDGTSCDMQKYFKGTPIHKYLHYVMDKDYKPFTNDANDNGNETGSVFAESTTYAVGGLGLLLGVAGGCGITAAANKSKKKKMEGENV